MVSEARTGVIFEDKVVKEKALSHCKTINYYELKSIEETITQLAMKECKNRIEVIGNIYDNKELLKND